MTTTNDNALSVQVFGEKTNLPIAVTKAAFQVTDALPFLQNKQSVVVTLNLVNKCVPNKNVAAKLKLVLPATASVKKFEMLRREDNLWYPATAVPKKKAAAVVYKEKEKGRAVAAVSNVGSSNVFEIEVSPLSYEVVTQCRLEMIMDNAQDLIRSMFPAKGSTTTQVVVESIPSLDSMNDYSSEQAGAIVGDSFGKTHFVCKVPAIPLPDKTDPIELGRVAILWDSSASMAPSTAQIASHRTTRLREVLAQAKTRTVELYTFGTSSPVNVGVYETIDDVLAAIGDIEYDGGTDITLLPKMIADLANRGEKIDCALVFTDGVINLGRTPVFEESYGITFPVHCVADGETINMRCLKTIAAASPLALGTVLTKKDGNYLQGVLFPQPVLRSIKTDQDDEAFVGERDDGFQCVPDYRLPVLNLPIGKDGLLITGILKAKGQDSVTKLTAEVVIGSQTREFHFQLGKVAEGSTDGTPTEGTSQTMVTNNCPTSWFSATEADSPAARILGHIYAEELYREAELFGLKSSTDTKRIREELAVSYGFCSPESSLLMLYTSEQFLEHGIRAPVGHPVACKETDEQQHEGRTNGNDKAGEVGGPKTEEQSATVCHQTGIESRDVLC